MRDGPGVELLALSEQECLDRLRLTSVGRLGLSVAALPVIVPINFTVVSDDSVIFCTGPGQKLTAADDGNVACLEVDDFDSFNHLGWSVLVTGRLSRVTDPEDLAMAGQLPVQPWRHFATEPSFVRLSTELLSGRTLTLGPNP